MRTYKDIPRLKYRIQKENARKRGIDWNITFEEWWAIWEGSGHWDNRGCRKGQYCMSRKGDQGAYESNNVFIQQHGQNVSDNWTGKIRGPCSDEHKQKISEAKKKGQ